MTSASESTPEKASKALEAVVYLNQYFDLYRSRTDQILGRRKGTNGPLRALTGEKNCLLNEVATEFLRQTGSALSKQAIETAKVYVEFEQSTKPVTTMHQRYAMVSDCIYVDLGDPDGTVVEISANKWSLKSECPVLFERNPLMRSLPVPMAGGDVGLLWKYLNVSDSMKPVILGWLVAAHLADIDHPLLTLLGMAGSGKSMATECLVGLIDPSSAQKTSLPRSRGDWIALAKNSYLLSFDNLSSVSSELSDMLCVLVTGGTLSARKLYTDSSLSYFEARRVLILNGITLTGHGADLTDRMLPVELTAMDANSLRDSDEMRREWLEELPLILGGLFDLTSQVLGLLDTVHPKQKTRMAKFCAVLACIDYVHKTDALTTYVDALSAVARLEASGEPLLVGIELAIDTHWVGTASELLSKLAGISSRLSVSDAMRMPSNSAALVSSLTRNAPTLRKMGWQLVEHPAGGHRKLKRYEFRPPIS